MIDPVNSLVSVISNLQGASSSGEPAAGEPIFMELLQAIAGFPANGTGLSGTSLRAMLAGVAQQALPGSDLSGETLPSSLNGGEGVSPDGGVTEKKSDQEDASAGLEMLMALLSAASQLQPWQIGMTNDTSAKKSGAAGEGDGQGVKISWLPEPLLALAPGGEWLRLEKLLAGQSQPLKEDAQMPVPDVATAAPKAGEVLLNPANVVSSPEIKAAGQVGNQANDPKVPAKGVLAPEGERLNISKAEPGIQTDPSKTAASIASTETDQAKSDLNRSQAKGDVLIGNPAPSKVEVVPGNRQDALQINPPGLVQIQGGRSSRGGSLADFREEAHSEKGDDSTTIASSQPGSDALFSIQQPEKSTGLVNAFGLSNRTRITTPEELTASIADQIARRANLMLGHGRAGLSLQLEPKDLGKVRVHVSFTSDGLQVRLAAETNNTRDIIQASLPQLKNAFESQGLTVDKFDLAVGPGFSGFQSSADSAPRQGLNSSQPTTAYGWNEDAEVEASETPAARTQTSLVDYRI